MKTLFFGDTSPSKTSKESFRRKEVDKLFTDVKDFMSDSEFTFVNLECALTECTEAIKKFGPALSAPKETAEILKGLGVDLCGLSNNHTFDLGIQGIKDTFDALHEYDMDYTGWGNDYEDSRKDYIVRKNGEKIAIITVCEHEYSYALENRMGARPFDEFDTMDDIRAAKASSDRVIVIYHGGKEYCRYPSPRLMRVCRAMARCGADMVLCQHSHCIGCYEEYQGCHILYGQGNFHFLSDSPHECWYTSLAVQYDTKSDEISFVPIRALEDGITLAKGADKDEIMSAFYKRNEELKTGEWQKGWHDFCISMQDAYCKNIANACLPESTEIDNAVFGHYLDCEAHTDVWRELFKTWNHTNCIGEEK
jgi:poly-gamma-glutamate synthesis protein (capsule biosynthesis protein)